MNFPTEPFHPGQRLTFRELDAIRVEVERLGRIAFVPPMGGTSEGGGIVLWYDAPWAGWIKLTGGGTGGKYAWTAQTATTGGTWTNADGNLSGTATVDPAYEANLNASVPLSPAPVVWAWRVRETGELKFLSGACT